MAEDRESSQLSVGAVRATLIVVALVVALWPAVVSPTPIVSIDSTPRGASAFINGRLAGSTPLQVVGLAQGSYSLRIEKSGYSSVQRNLLIGSTSLPINENLNAIQTESLILNVTPEGAEVVLDGEIRGHTPLVLPDIAVGWHELEIRRSNFNTYAKRILIEHGTPQVYKLALDDKILEMLKRNIAKEPQSVRHYMDMGQYLYRSREVLESAKYFAKALEIAAVPIEFAADISPAEQAIENDQHAKEREKLNFVINDKEQTPSKDRQEFTRIIEATREMLNNSATNFKSWDWIRDQTLHYANQGKLDQAQQLLLKHIETVKDNAKLEQAYVLLLDTQLQMKRMDLSHDTYLKIANAYALRPELLRQAGHALYSKQGAFEEPDRADVLKMSETLFRSAIAVSKKFNELEMAGQCSFELGNVLCYQERTELAAGVYRDSIDLTKAVTAKEDRMQRLVDCLKKLKKYSDAHKVLYDLSKSPRTDISTRAKQDLKALELQEPSPDNK